MASIPNYFVQKISEDTDILAYIQSRGVELKKAGKEYVGLCPLHNEKTPSFSVNPGKNNGVWNCHGCGKGGDAIGFVREFDNVNFPEAIEILAQFNNVPMPKPAQPESQIDKEKAELVALMERASRLYQKELTKSPETIAYLRKRGVTQEMSDKFGLGFAPHGSFILNTMNDVPVEKLIKAGLVRESSVTPGKMVDALFKRVMFPIRTPSGKTIAFGGRLMTDEKARKYINTGETAIFKKGDEAYGLFEGLAAIRKTRTAIVAEGYMDVIIPHGNGVENVICAMGTALSEKSIQRLFKSADNLVFCFDGDKAGNAAAVRALEIVIKVIDAHHTAKFCFLPNGMDPDEYVSTHGAEKFQELTDTAVPLSKFLIQHNMSLVDMDSAEGKAKFTVDTMAMANQIKDATLKLLVFDAIRNTIGPHIPIEGLKASSLPIPTPTSNTDVAQRRGFAGLARDVEDNTPAPVTSASLGLRVLSMIITLPETANYFEPHWLKTVNSTDAEISALETVIDTIRSNKYPPTTKDILEQFKETPLENLLSQACNLEERKVTSDVAAQLTEIVNFLSDQQNRMAEVSAIFQRKLRP